VGHVAQVSAAINGGLGFSNNTSLFSSVTTQTSEKLVSSGVPTNIDSGHGAGASLFEGCHLCLSFTTICIGDTQCGECEGSDGPSSEWPNLPNKQFSCPPECSPILIDTAKNGFHFGDADHIVFFDLVGQGEVALQWVAGGEDDAFLAIDINGNGLVDNGGELFGIGTKLLLEGDQLAPNGFVALSQFDEPALGGNNDGYITNEDQVWGFLYLWLDWDADGVSTHQEMTHIEDSGLKRFETIPKEAERFDEHGNWLRYWASAHDLDVPSRKHKMIDVYFVRASQ
jgi:hypothetical protein